MSITCRDGTIHVVGDAWVEDAEPLAALLMSAPGQAVDWSRSQQLHAAVVQVLLAFRPAMVGTPEDEFSRRWLAPLLTDGEF